MIDKEELTEIFDQQYGELPCGGFLNPTIEGEHNGIVHIRCFYDNFDNEEDSWYYFFDIVSKQFYS